MKIGIYYHESKVPRENAERLTRLVRERGAEGVAVAEEEIEGVDRLIVLGGDGAVLRASRRAAEKGIPVVAVNYGHLGFLTQFERDEEEEAVALALDENARLASRSMLEATFRGKTEYFLNELALMRRISPDSEDAVVRICVEIDGTAAGEFTADGLILATPTGSTAYSLSAGGIVLTPDCPAFLLTPVNAFSMRSRPIACSDGSEFVFTFPQNGVVVHGDGIFLGQVGRGDVVKVRKAARSAVFLTKEKSDFFRRLTEKIN